ncbi:Anti-FecI sigma factor, FecR [Nitrospira japonica]|uniref:Anti-FecI sigma factor, FecR n=1 Tax=Nitrospira japonica TaxID=1325564 RepID=A0A1W1IAQ9_9BACT|nr:FecR family protein [Nitrospira japonica]SLM50094.1 Anti-FecI sigma factor, FecR [Nitrospira japonica]
MTATTMSSDLRHQEIFAEAAQWVVRLGAESVTEAERAACRRWKAQSPVHEAAFDHAEGMWRHVAQVGQMSHESGISAKAAPSLASVNRSRWLPIAACCAGLALASIFLFEEVRVLMTADYRTVAGERREVALPDNSRVTLNTGSAIALHFDDHERRVELLNGEALFVAAPMQGAETRPFVVSAGSSRARAMGTQFLVRRTGRTEEVTVIEHRVAVSLQRESAFMPVVVDAGHRVRYDSVSGLGAVADANIDQATSWQRGRLMFDRMPLDEVIAEINRYRRGRIVVLNKELAGRRVSGVVMIDKIDDSLSLITSELGATTTSLSPLLTFLY